MRGQFHDPGQGVMGQLADELAAFLLLEPVLIPPKVPIAQVLLADGVAIKLPVQDGLHGREGVQPMEQGFPGFPVRKPLVQLLPQMGGEASDFTTIDDVHNLASTISMFMLYVNILIAFCCTFNPC